MPHKPPPPGNPYPTEFVDGSGSEFAPDSIDATQESDGDNIADEGYYESALEYTVMEWEAVWNWVVSTYAPSGPSVPPRPGRPPVPPRPHTRPFPSPPSGVSDW